MPDSAGTLVTFPASTPIVGNAMGWFSGRVHAPSATLFDHQDITVVFAGHHAPKPKNGLGDNRTIGRVRLHSDHEIVAIGQRAGDNAGSEE